MKKRYVQRHGTKQYIAEELINVITNHVPDYKQRTFVDLFWWGWAMSATALNVFNNVIYNEIEKDVHDLFIWVQDDSVIQNLKHKWISREMFMNIKNKWPSNIEENLILTAWSFWNNRRDYIYWKNIENIKRLTHMIIYAKTEEEYIQYCKQYVKHFEKYWAIWDVYIPHDDWNEFSKSQNKRWYKFWKNARVIRKFTKDFDIELLKQERWNFVSSIDVKLIKEIEWPNQPENLQRLERLQSLERLENITTYTQDYRNVSLPKPNECVLYLDPPYIWTWKYETEFNHNEFYWWIQEKKNEWYILFCSEYTLPLWDIIWSKKKRWFVSQKKENITWEEKLFMIKQ